MEKDFFENNRVEIKNAFPTPIIMTLIPNFESINKRLKKVIMAKEKKVGKLKSYSSNIGGWHSDRDMDSWGGKQFEKIISIAKAIASRNTAMRNGKPNIFSWSANAWSNINRKGDSNEFHIHPGAFWSGVYYVDDGGCFQNKKFDGEFTIMDPRGSGPSMYAPSYCFQGPEGQSVGATELLSPRNGIMLIFPSWLYHGVRPYKGNSERISISFNLSISESNND